MIHNAAPRAHRAQLESKLLNRLGRQIRDLRIHVRDTGVVLYGQATTYYAKQLAQHAAMEITGLPVLANEIEVH
jgi:osmotically-inducible protein OsmY